MNTKIEIYHYPDWPHEIGVCVPIGLSDGATRRLVAEELDLWRRMRILREVPRVRISRSHPVYPCDCPHKNGDHVHRVLRRVP